MGFFNVSNSLVLMVCGGFGLRVVLRGAGGRRARPDTPSPPDGAAAGGALARRSSPRRWGGSDRAAKTAEQREPGRLFGGQAAACR